MTMSMQARLTLGAATAMLLTALTLRPVVQGWGWFLILAVVVAAMTMAGAAVRQMTHWWLPVVTAQLVTLIATVTALFARDDAFGGVVPGPDAVRAMTNLAAEGLEVTRLQAPPVDATQGVLFIVTCGLALVAFTVDLLALTARRPAVAGLPLLAVYCVPASVLRDGLSWFWFSVAALGFLILVSSDAGERVRSWGRVLGETGGDDEVPAAARWASSSGVRAGAAALALAVVIPVLMPGLGERLIGTNGEEGGGEGGSRTRAVVNPILDLRRNLNARRDRIVLTYRTTVDRPDPLRIVSSDVFDGRVWSPSAALPPDDNRVQAGLDDPPGLSPQVPAMPERTEISIGVLRQNYLPLPYPARRVNVPGTWLFDSRSLNVMGRDVTTQGISYSVDHLRIVPTADQLGTAAPASALIAGPYTRLPAGVPAVVRDTARQIAGTGTPYTQAVRLQDYFRSSGGFAYSQNAPGSGRDDSSLEVMESFLRERRGYCVHFASTMAVMARSLGIPARVAVGFLPGERRTDGTWEVTLRDAHAWPELYFQNLGWVRFEPTPSVRTADAPAWTVPSATDLPTTPTTPTPAASEEPVPTGPEEEAPVEDGSGWLSGRFDSVPWRGLVVVVVLLLLSLVPMTVVGLRRRLRWRRSRSRVGQAETAWEELRERLADLGVVWSRSRTPRSVQALVGERWSLEGRDRAALDRLVADLEGARYTRPGSSEGRPPERIVADVRSVAKAVGKVLPARNRQRARWFPPSAFGWFSSARRPAGRIETPVDAGPEPGPGSGAELVDEITLSAQR